MAELIPYAGAERRLACTKPAHVKAVGRRRGEINPIISKRVCRARLEAGLSQEDLADAIGVSQGVVQHYERGRMEIKASRLYAIACVLRKPIDWFFA